MAQLFKDQTVIISGGLGDIGRAMATAFAREGANIGLCDLHAHPSSEEFLDTLRQYEVRVSYGQVDVTDAGAVANWVLKLENELGVSTIIIANAATATFTGVMDMTSAQWSQEMKINLDGAFYLAQSAASRLLAHGLPGRLVFIGSWAAHSVHTHIPAYCVSKAGLRMLCKVMAAELAPHNILVNEVAPGYVDAGLSGRSFQSEPAAREQALQQVPIKKIISAEEVAWQVVQLCHPLNVHVTGTTVLMDGGLSLIR